MKSSPALRIFVSRDKRVDRRSYVFALPGLANLGEWKQFGDYFSEAVDR